MGFGHHVMASVLEHGSCDQQQKIIEVLCSNLPSHVGNRSSNFVIEAVLMHCPGLKRPLIEQFVHGGTDLSAALQLSKLKSLIDHYAAELKSQIEYNAAQHRTATCQL